MKIEYAFIFRQAFVNMGYRPMNSEESIWGKPVGFGIIIAEVKEDTIKVTTMFQSAQDKPMIWSRSKINTKNEEGLEGEEFYKKCVHDIAYAEFEAHTDKILFPTTHKTFDFK